MMMTATKTPVHWASNVWTKSMGTFVLKLNTKQHTSVLEQHTSVLEQHTSVIEQHTSVIEQHTSVIELNTKQHNCACMQLNIASLFCRIKL